MKQYQVTKPRPFHLENIATEHFWLVCVPLVLSLKMNISTCELIFDSQCVILRNDYNIPICKTQVVLIHPECCVSTPKTCAWSLGYMFRKTTQFGSFPCQTTNPIWSYLNPVKVTMGWSFHVTALPCSFPATRDGEDGTKGHQHHAVPSLLYH